MREPKCRFWYKSGMVGGCIQMDDVSCGGTSGAKCYEPEPHRASELQWRALPCENGLYLAKTKDTDPCNLRCEYLACRLTAKGQLVEWGNSATCIETFINQEGIVGFLGPLPVGKLAPSEDEGRYLNLAEAAAGVLDCWDNKRATFGPYCIEPLRAAHSDLSNQCEAPKDKPCLSDEELGAFAVNYLHGYLGTAITISLKPEDNAEYGAAIRARVEPK